MAENLAPLEAGELFDPRFNRDMNIAQRMHLAMTRADYVQKEKKEGMKYTIVSHDKVTKLARDIFQQVGIIYYPSPDGAEFVTNGNRVELKLVVRFENIDNRDDTIDVLGIGYGIDPGDKGPGKATSYAVKYALLKALGLETGDDPDQDQDVKHRSNTQQRADRLVDEILVADVDQLTYLLSNPAVSELMQALQARDMATYQEVNGHLMKRAKALGTTIRELKGGRTQEGMEDEQGAKP